MYHKFLSGIPYIHHWPIKLATSSTKKFYMNVKNHVPTCFKEKILDELLFYELLNCHGTTDVTYGKNEYEILDLLKTPQIIQPRKNIDMYNILRNIDYPADTLKYFPNIITYNVSKNIPLRHSLWQYVFSSVVTDSQIEKAKEILAFNIHTQLDKQFFCGNRCAIKKILSNVSFPRKKTKADGELILQYYYIDIPQNHIGEDAVKENPIGQDTSLKITKRYKVYLPKFLTDNPHFIRDLYRLLLGDIFLCKLSWSLGVNKIPSSDFMLEYGSIDWFNKLFQANHISHILGKYSDPITELLQKELVSILLHLTIVEIMSRKNTVDADSEILLLQEYVNSDKSAGFILSQCLDKSTHAIEVILPESGKLKRHVDIPTYRVSLSKLKDSLRLRLSAQPDLKNKLISYGESFNTYCPILNNDFQTPKINLPKDYTEHFENSI